MDIEDEDQPPDIDVIIIFIVFFEGGLAPLALLLGWWWGRNPLASFAWDFRHLLAGILATIPPILLFTWTLRWPVGGLRKIKQFLEEEFCPMLAGARWSDIALIALSAGVGEEMLFRGVLQPSLVGWLGLVWGVALTSLLFGLLHPISVPYAVVASLLGLYLGLVFLLTGNLLTVIITHTLYNFSLMAYLLKIHPPDGPLRERIPAVDEFEDIDAYEETK